MRQINRAMNFPGDLEEHLKKAHAAVHGREMWDARYGDVCDLLKRARKLLHDIEKTAEVAEQGAGAPQVMGKADPVDKADRSELVPIPRKTVPSIPGKPGTIKPAKRQTPRQAARTRQKFARDQWGGKSYPVDKADSPFTTRQPIPGGGSAKKPKKTKTVYGPTRADVATFPRRKPQKALRKAVTAAVRQAGR